MDEAKRKGAGPRRWVEPGEPPLDTAKKRELQQGE